MEAPPLAGVRVIDLTAWQAGPQATMILADYGADVVKVEAPQRLDGWRGGAGLTEDRMYERNPFWNAVNRGNRSVAAIASTRDARSAHGSSASAASAASAGSGRWLHVVRSIA